jgi:hypothetical protein
MPFLRSACFVSFLFRGAEIVRWQGTVVEIDTGEFEGCYQHFSEPDMNLEFEWLVNQCASGGVLCDVLANQRIVALTLTRAFPELRVVAFEPDPANAG